MGNYNMTDIPVFTGGSKVFKPVPAPSPVDRPVTHIPAFQPGVKVENLKPLNPRSGKVRTWPPRP